MKVRAAKEYVDDAQLDLAGMVEDLKNHKGTSGSSCPSVGEWLEAFGEAEAIFVLTISKNLSGSYNSALQAASAYLEEHPERKVYVFNTLSAGPQQAMMIDKIQALCQEGLDFETVVEKVNEYHDHTHIIFCLESMMNLARNGRVSMAAAKIAGVLGIRGCGDAKAGQITATDKPRGAKKATETLVRLMKEHGFYDGAILRIAHCFGESAALALRDAIVKEFPNTKFQLEPTTALCSFYAEAGGLMIGFEGGYSEENNHLL